MDGVCDVVSLMASTVIYRLGLFGACCKCLGWGRLTVVFYHDVVTTNPLPELSLHIEHNLFDEHLSALAKHYHFVGMSELADHRAMPPRPLVLTFDGYSNTFLEVAEGLSRKGFKAVFYLQTEPILCGRPHWRQQVYFLFRQMPAGPFALRSHGMAFSADLPKDPLGRLRVARTLANGMEGMSNSHEVVSQIAEQAEIDLADFNRTYRPLTPDETGVLAALPGIEIGSHSHRHLVLKNLPLAQGRDELQVSKQLLERWTQQPIRHYAYPSGQTSNSVLTLLPQLGYKTAVVTGMRRHRLHTAPEWPYLIPRFGIPSRPFVKVAGRLVGIEGILAKLARLRRRALQDPSHEV